MRVKRELPRGPSGTTGRAEKAECGVSVVQAHEIFEKVFMNPITVNNEYTST